jgi:hypothetical protein
MATVNYYGLGCASFSMQMDFNEVRGCPVVTLKVLVDLTSFS